LTQNLVAAAEQVVAGLPHTILRATQFHDLVYKVLAGAAKLPVMPLRTISAPTGGRP
jgi:hypothetical protein